MLTRLVILLCTLATSTAANSLSFDFDGDTFPETIRLIKGHHGYQHMLIESDTLPTIFAPKIAQTNNAAQNTTLQFSPKGSPQVEIAHLGIGRHKWILTFTLAYRQNAVRIAGLTYQYYDTLNLDAGGTCDLNLLSRKAIYSPNKGKTHTWAIEIPTPPIHSWNTQTALWDTDLLPQFCFE